MAEDRHMPQPTPEHQFLKKSLGRWRVDCTYYQNPNHPPLRVTATETVEMIGEFWSRSRFQAQMEGFILEGSSTVGFEPHRGKWVSTWIDNSTPALFHFEGERGEDSTIREMNGSGPSPFGGETTRFRSVETILGDDQRQFDMYITLETGDEMQMFSYLYTREDQGAQRD